MCRSKHRFRLGPCERLFASWLLSQGRISEERTFRCFCVAVAGRCRADSQPFFLQFIRVRSSSLSYEDVTQPKMKNGAKDVEMSPFNVTDRSALVFLVFQAH